MKTIKTNWTNFIERWQNNEGFSVIGDEIVVNARIADAGQFDRFKQEILKEGFVLSYNMSDEQNIIWRFVK